MSTQLTREVGDGVVAPSAEAARLELRKANLWSAMLGRPTLVVGVLLVVLTLAHVFSATDSGLRATLILAGAALALAIYVLTRRTAMEQIDRGVGLDRQREYERALAVLQPVALTSLWASVRAYATIQWAFVAHKMGRYADADKLLREVIDKDWARRQRFGSAALAIYWTLACASIALGNLEDARSWIETGKAASDADAVQWYIAEALFLARSERWQALVDWLDNRTSELEGQLNGQQVRLLDMLEALASTELSEEDARDPHLVDGLLRGARRGQFDDLAAAWPTLREFLRAHVLLAD
jgi:tetratricopeptide (TPR) repeat protein